MATMNSIAMATMELVTDRMTSSQFLCVCVCEDSLLGRMSDNKPKNKMASKSGSTKETSKAPTKDTKENSTENMNVFAALADYKLEFKSSQKKLENVQVGLERHRRKQEAMSEQIKGLTQEKTTLQQNCDKLSGRCRYLEAEFNKVTKENCHGQIPSIRRFTERTAGSGVKKACDDVELYKIHNRELRDQVATIPLLKKNLENMQLKDKKQTRQLQETLSELEEVQ
uniref:Uncharacterized protein n=1 Tax=Knipowitschia caucasica TaxID=637954 RepID=A0AAV2JJ35_KNICA